MRRRWAGAALLGALLLSTSAAAAPPAPGCALAGPDLDVAWPRATARRDPEAQAGAPPLRRIADVPLPGSASRFDYQSVDPELGRLYIAHMGAGTLVVFGLREGRVLAAREGFPRITGVLAVPQEHRVYASVPGDHRLAVVDAATLRSVGSVPGIRFPDGIAYVPGLRRVFVSDESGRQDVVVDARANTALARIPLGGEAGNTRYDPASRCILVAVQTKDLVAVIDPRSLQVVRRIRLHGVAFPHGLLVDARRRLLFVAGAGNAVLGILDADSLAPLATRPLGDDPDVLALDPGSGMLYVASESGVVGVFRIRGKVVTPLGTLVAPQAHSVAVDPATHRVYLPLANVAGRPVLRILEPTGAAGSP